MKKLVLMLCFVCLACQTGWGQVNTVWAKKTDGIGTKIPYKIVVDNNHNVYTIGTFDGTTDFDPSPTTFNITPTGAYDVFIQKLDANGNFIWVKTIGNTSSEFGMDMKVDASGNVYSIGSFVNIVDFDPNSGVYHLDSGSGGGVYIQKLDTNGNFVWAKALAGVGVAMDMGKSIDIDNLGNVYITGGFIRTTDFDPNAGVLNLTPTGSWDIFVQKLNINGDLVWVKQIGGIGQDMGNRLKLDSFGNIYVVGYFENTVDFNTNVGGFSFTSFGSFDIFALKLDNNGNFIWAKQTGGIDEDMVNDVELVLNNGIVLTGAFKNIVDFDPNNSIFTLTSAGNADIFVQYLDTDGNLIWAKRMGGSFKDEGYSVATDVSGNIFITGSFSNLVDFDPNSGTVYLSSNGSEDDAFIQKISNNGNLVFAKKIGAFGKEAGKSITTNGDYIYTNGFFQNNVNFQLNNCAGLMMVGNWDTYIMKIAPYNLNPTISFLPVAPTLNTFNTTYCQASSYQSFQVQGNDLFSTLDVTAPNGYEITTNPLGEYFSIINIGNLCGVVTPITIYIRLKNGNAQGSYNASLVISNNATPSQTLLLSGNVVGVPPTLNFVGLNDSYCLNTPSFPLSAMPSGGIFTINNGTATQFNPSILGAGNHVVRYAYIDGNGCLSTKEKTVVVHPLPTLSNNVNLSYSTNQIGFTIIGSPAGSTYTVNGTPVIEFTPSTLGVGTHTLVQTFTDANGCSNSLTKTINIIEPLTLTSTAGATCWKNAVVNVDANITITSTTTMTGAIVSFGAGYNSTQDRLIYPIPMFGVTGSFDVPTGVLKLIGTATTAQYQQILRSIQYHNISASPAYGTTRTINFTAGDVLPLYPCGSADAHFYKFIPAPAITWQNAKIAAEAQNYFGMKGYLATISCTQENNFAFNSIAQKGWIGASDDVAFTGAYSPNGEGQWYWVTGPEAGTRFWQGNQPGSPVGGLYNNWDAGEPNNWQNTNESFAHLLESGRWNDYTFNNSSIVGYFIEFGGLPTDPNVQTTTSKQIQIATKPDFFISGQVCIDAAPIALTGSPTGGTFKINGNVATSLNPSVLGVGAHTVVYELAGCTIPTSKVVNVTPLPTVSISGLQASYCVDVATVALTGSPAGGTFTINGGVATQFSPSTAGAGNYTIKYTYTNGNGCTNSTTQNVVVAPLPTAQLTGLSDSYCITQASFALQGTPAGGTFKINAFDATVFDAQTLGAGIYTVTYTVSNGICNDTDQKIVEVVAPPTISFDNVPNEYCSQAVPITLQASPVGGTFTINGVATNLFNPADYAIGDEVVIKYEYGILAGCSSSLTKTIKVVFSSSFEQASFDWEVCPSGTAGEPLEALSAG
ncbi:MAG: hypothetical protein EAZ95_07265, partial [Bacteroidetes bacterium]